MNRTLSKSEKTFFGIDEDDPCDHLIDESKEFGETKYTGKFTCLRRQSVLEYDVSDIGD